MPETQVELEAKARLALLENLKNIILAHLSGRYDIWDGDRGPMFNLYLRNANAESPVKEFVNKAGETVKIATIGELCHHIVENLRHSGYWINFTVRKPDARGVVTPQTVTLWSYAKQGFVVCRGRESYTDTQIEGTVLKSEPKQPKIVDASGKEVVGANFKLSFSGFGGAPTAGVSIG